MSPEGTTGLLAEWRLLRAEVRWVDLEDMSVKSRRRRGKVTERQKSAVRSSNWYSSTYSYSPNRNFLLEKSTTYVFQKKRGRIANATCGQGQDINEIWRSANSILRAVAIGKQRYGSHGRKNGLEIPDQIKSGSVYQPTVSKIKGTRSKDRTS